MDSVILGIVPGVLLIVSAGWLLFVRPRRGRGPAAPTPSQPASKAPASASASDSQAPAGQAQADRTPAAAAPAATIDIERPPPSAGRLVRLRARLARSQSSMGGVLLNLLSRDRLDDETWDEI